MRYPTFLFTLLLVVFQSCAPTHYRLLYRTNDAGQIRSDLRKVQLRWQAQQVDITTVSGQKQEVSASKVWGYEEINGKRFRLYLDQFYEVVQSQGMTIYCRHNFGEGSVDEFFFSKTPFEELFYLNVRNLNKVFASDSCMQEIITQLSPRSWLKTDSKGTCRLIDAYHHCHAFPNEISTIVSY